MVPTSTGAAKSLKMIIPELANKIDGVSIGANPKRILGSTKL